MKRANDDLQYKLSNRAGMKEERKKQKGTIPDTGSAFSTGGQMLKGGQKKLDKNKDGKISGDDFKMMKAKYGKMMKANKGMEAKSTKGYGAARTSGMGLQDQSLKSGQNYEITKGGDYIKDLI